MLLSPRDHAIQQLDDPCEGESSRQNCNANSPALEIRSSKQTESTYRDRLSLL